MPEKWLALLNVITGRLLGERALRADPAPLFEELVGDGFAPEEVATALAWVERFFAGLPRQRAEAGDPITSTGHRTRSVEELFSVSPGAFGYLMRLENAGVIDAALREEILERALAACDEEVGEEEIREISRFVLESQGRDGSAADTTDDARSRQRHLH
jgi:Smg protein